MAIWQFTLQIIPRNGIAKKDDSERNELGNWTNYSITKTSLDKISIILKLTKSWLDILKSVVDFAIENDSLFFESIEKEE